MPANDRSDRRDWPTPPRAPAVAAGPRPTLADLRRRVERLAERGLPLDTVARAAASWLRASGLDTGELGQALGRVGLPGRGPDAPGRTPTPRSPRVFALQLKRAAGTTSPSAAPSLADALARLGPGRPIPAPLRARLATALRGRSVDLARVLVHDGADADALCRDLGAEALALGSHIAVRRGLLADADEACALLAHELTHVWQQQTGRVPRRDGALGEGGLEAEAERVERDARAEIPASAPRGRGLDSLAEEARGHVRRTRARPAATFVVADRVTAYDDRFRLRGSWPLTAPCPLPAGFHRDGADPERWSGLPVATLATLVRGGEALWVVGPRDARASESADPTALRPGHSSFSAAQAGPSPSSQPRL